MSSPNVTQRFKKMGRNIQAKLKSKQQQHDLLNARYESDDLDVVPVILKRYHIWQYALNPRKFCEYLIHKIQYGFLSSGAHKMPVFFTVLGEPGLHSFTTLPSMAFGSSPN